ncbi:MAG: hypothetical protein SGILL_007888, partial [Bacillariaceae sp.]
DYQEIMEQAICDVKTKGSSAVTPAQPTKEAENVLCTLDDDDMETLVECGPETAKSPPGLDGELELSVMGLYEMHQNQKLVKALKKHKRTSGDKEETCPNLWIDAKVQLPLNPDDPTQPVHLAFRPTSSRYNGPNYEYQIDSTSEKSRQKLKLPTKDSKEAKTLRRRMESKTIQYSVYFAPHLPADTETKKTSWLFGSRTAKEEVPPIDPNNKGVLLGKVVVECNSLLSKSCIIGDFPLLVNSQEIGGRVRLAIRAAGEGNKEAMTSPPRIEVHRERVLLQ